MSSHLLYFEPGMCTLACVPWTECSLSESRLGRFAFELPRRKSQSEINHNSIVMMMMVSDPSTSSESRANERGPRATSSERPTLEQRSYEQTGNEQTSNRATSDERRAPSAIRRSPTADRRSPSLLPPASYLLPPPLSFEHCALRIERRALSIEYGMWFL